MFLNIIQAQTLHKGLCFFVEIGLCRGRDTGKGVLVVNVSLERTISSINLKELMKKRGIKLEVSERKVYAATLKDGDGRTIEQLDIPVETDKEMQALLTGYQLALAQK